MGPVVSVNVILTRTAYLTIVAFDVQTFITMVFPEGSGIFIMYGIYSPYSKKWFNLLLFVPDLTNVM